MDFKIDKETEELLDRLQKKLSEEGLDYVVTVAHRDVTVGDGKEEADGMCCLCYQSEAPILPAMLLGMAGHGKMAARFVDDLMTLIARFSADTPDSGALSN